MVDEKAVRKPKQTDLRRKQSHRDRRGKFAKKFTERRKGGNNNGGPALQEAVVATDFRERKKGGEATKKRLF